MKIPKLTSVSYNVYLINHNACITLFRKTRSCFEAERLPGFLGSVAGSCNPFAMKGGNGGPLVRRAVTRVTLGRRVKVPFGTIPF